MKEPLTVHTCMICGGDRRLAREGSVVLCERCLTALGRALSEKLGLAFPQEDFSHFEPQARQDE